MLMKINAAKFVQSVKNYFSKIFKLENTFALFLISAFAVILTCVRVLVTRQPMYLFMLPNLLLAFIPWLLASFIYVNEIRNKTVIIIVIALWLLFFPNAPYMLTDLIHLGKNRSAPLWYDLILLLTFGFAGLFYGFISLQMIEEKIGQEFNARHTKIISVVLIYVSCFGIYLGRYLRWNSWDLFSSFNGLMRDVLCRFVSPVEYWRTWGFTILAGTLLNLVYLLVRKSSLK